MTIKIELQENDFAAVMTPAERRAVFGTERVLAEANTMQSPTSILEELLPSALVAKVRRLTPPDFQLSEITIDAEVSGKVLGTGVSGNFSMKLIRSTIGRTPADAGELKLDVSAGAPTP